MKYYEAIQFEVGPEHDGWRLDTVLRQGYGLSRRLLVRLKKTEKGIMVMGDFEIERRIASWHINLYRVLARKLDMPFGLLHKPN